MLPGIFLSKRKVRFNVTAGPHEDLRHTECRLCTSDIFEMVYMHLLFNVHNSHLR